jgi:hypothetical protein
MLDELVSYSKSDWEKREHYEPVVGPPDIVVDLPTCP